MTISTILNNNLCLQYETEKVMCPPKLKINFFTNAALDNIDHNPSSTTAKDSFHGTGISLFQHPQHEASEVERTTVMTDSSTFIIERLVQQTKPINDPIKRNNFPLFSRPPVREKSKSKQQLLSLKNDCSLFSSLYISCQRRDGDLDDFFKHENKACPPSLSSMGKLRLGTKSDIVSCLKNLIDIDEVSNPKVDAVILDGAAIVNMLRPGTADTFSEYASKIFLPYITKQLQGVQRLDVVWDEYVQSSLKAYT